MSSSRQYRNTARGFAALSGAVLLLASSGCVEEPAPPPAPTMPAGVGFDWVRYSSSSTWSRRQFLDGAVSEPVIVPVASVLYAPLSPRNVAASNLPLFPDGTARFPWNGFAGEGITTEITTASTPYGTAFTYAVTGPGGTCTFTDVPAMGPSVKHSAAVPSPDGTKLAVYSQYQDLEAANQTWLTIHDLDDACATRATARYNYSTSFGSVSGERILSSLSVWSPDSTAIVYPVGAPFGNGASRVEILSVNAAPAPTPTTVVSASDAVLMPLGWSPTGRILVQRTTLTTGLPTEPSQLETIGVDGQAQRVIDSIPATTPLTMPTSHLGFFVPGTNQIIYTGGPRTATVNGKVWAWPQIRLYDDATGANGAIAATDSPLAGTNAPEVEFVERFVRAPEAG